MVFILLLDGVPYATAGGQRWWTTSRDEAERAAESLRKSSDVQVQVCAVPGNLVGA
jgi:hypothetical protein